MKKFLKKAAIVLSCVSCLALTGCGGEKLPKTFTLDGHTYDLSKSMPELMGEMNDNGVWVLDAMRLSSFGENGNALVVDKCHQIGPESRKEHPMVGVLCDYVLEDPKNEFERIAETAVTFQITYPSKETRHGFSIGEIINDKDPELGAYYDIQGHDFDRAIQKIYSGKDEELKTLEDLDQKCLLPGYMAITFPRQQAIAVYYDGKQVNLKDYYVTDLDAFIKDEKTFYVPTGKVDSLAYIKYRLEESGICSSDNWNEVYEAASQEWKDNMDRDAAVMNAVYQGMLSMQDGKMKRIQVSVLLEGGYQLTVIDKDGKLLRNTIEDHDDFTFKWQ